MSNFLKDTLIICNPAINEIPKFSAIAGSAIYIVEHSESGAVGVRLNKNYSKSMTEISEIHPVLKPLNQDTLLTTKVLAGGPLHDDLPWILGRNFNAYEKSIKNNALSLNFSESAFIDNGYQHFSICGLGTFGWGEKQLEQEIANFMWHIIPTTQDALESIPFDQEFHGAAQIISALKFA